MTRDELTQAFSLEGISGGNAVFNPEKLDWMNQQYVARLGPDELARVLEPFLRDAGLWDDRFASADRHWFLKVIELFKPRIKRLATFVDEARPFFSDDIQYDDAAVRKHLQKARLRDPLAAWHDALSASSTFDAASLEVSLKKIADEQSVKAGELIHATRVAVTGRAVSPGLYETLELIGRERTVKRLDHALSRMVVANGR
jgi:glutamyl/glutaminyl-tRNA synthetase